MSEFECIKWCFPVLHNLVSQKKARFDILPQYFLVSHKYTQAWTDTDFVQRKHNLTQTLWCSTSCHGVSQCTQTSHWGMGGDGPIQKQIQTEKAVSLESKCVRRTYTRAWRADSRFVDTFFRGTQRSGYFEDYYFVKSALNLDTLVSHISVTVWALTENLVEFFVRRRYLQYLCQTEAMSTDRLSSMSKEVKPESVSLCPLGTAAAPEQELLCIYGTGDFGRSLDQRLLLSGYRVVYGSRRPHSCGPLPQGTQVQHVACNLTKVWI